MDNYQNIGRPWSMLEGSSSLDADPNTLRISFAPERTLVPALRPLSTMRTISASMNSLDRRSDVPFGGSTRGSFSVSKADYPKTRQDDGNPFQVDILKGITGIGAKVRVVPEGFTQIFEIQNGGPVDKIGQIRVGDYLLSVNNTELTGQTDARVQQILRLLPRGITKLVISSQIPISDNRALDNRNNFMKAQNIVQGEKANTSKFDTFGKHQSTLDSEQPFMNLENDASPHYQTLPRTTTRNSPLGAAAQDITQTEHMLTVIQNANNKDHDSYPVPAPRTKHNKVHHKFVSHPGNFISSYESQVAKTDSSIHKHFGDVSNQVQEDDIVFPVEESLVPAAKLNNSFRNYDFSQSIEGMYTRVPILRSSMGAPAQLEADTFMFQESRPASYVSSKVSFPHPQNFEHFQNTEQEFFSSKINDFAPKSLAIYMEKTEEPYMHQSPRAKQARNSETSTERIEAFIITSRATINPGYLGKSKISSESSIKSDDMDDVFVPNQEHPQSISYLRMQSIKGSSKPSAETDNPEASFMPFDPVTTNINANSEPVVTAKRISVSVVTNSEISKPLNKSLMPLQDRYKNKGTSLSSYQPTHSSAAIHPRTASYSSAGATDTTNAVPSPRNSENVYDKIKLTADTPHTIPSFPRNSASAYDKIKVVNSPNMNSALSPKRTSSSDSPATLSLNYPMKYPQTKKEPYWKSVHKQKKDSEHLDTCTHSSDKTPNRNILSHLPRQKTSSYPSDHHSLPSTTSALSHFPPMSIKKNDTALDSTMKKFDELLIDAPDTRTQTDPNDLLFWAPETDKNLTSAQAKSMLRENLKEKIPQIKKHLTYLRKMRDSYGYEPEKLTKDEYEVQQERDLKGQSREALIVDTMRKAAEKSFAELLDYVNWVDNLSPNHSEADSNFPEKSSSNVLLDDNVSNFIIENKIYNRAENEMQQNDDSVKEFDKLLGSVSSKTYNINENQELTHFNELETREHSLQLSQIVIGDSRNNSYNNQKSKETNMQDQESLNNNLNDDNVVMFYGKEQNESQEDEVGFLKEKARQIVEDVIEKIRADSYKFWDNAKPASFLEPTSSTSSYDEPPSLPDTPPPPLPNTLPPSFFPNEVSAPQIPYEYLDISEPFLSDASIEHLVTEERPSITWSLSKQPVNDSAVFASIYKQQIENQPTESNITQHEGKTDKSFQNYTAEEDKESKADSIEALNSTGDSFHDGYGVRGQSHSPFDMLSEDSGMAVDDDQEVATDDAISLPGEIAEAEPDSGRIIYLPSELAVNMFSFSAAKQESTGKLSKATEKESFLHENDEFVDYVDGAFDRDNVNGVLLPPLLPSSRKSVSSTEHDNLKSLDDIFSHNSTSINMTSNTQQLSKKDAVSNEINSRNQDIGIAHKEMVSSLKRPQEQMVSDSHDINSYRVQSKRKWCLRSNLSRFPVLHGDSDIPIIAEYTEKNLLKSLPFNDLITLFKKLNTVLDAASAPLSLVLTVLHIHMDGDCIPLGIDLKHEGGTWFRVSGIKKGSPVWEEGGAQVGDWLIAVDSLWCDQVSVMRFLSRLAKPKHDTLLVFGREEESLDSSALLAETKSHSNEGNQLLPQNVLLSDDLKPEQSSCVKTSQPVKNAHFIDQQLTVDEQVPPLLDLVSMPSKRGAHNDNGASSPNDQPVAFFSRTHSPTYTDQAQAVPKTALLSSKDEILPRAKNADSSVKDPASPQWMRSRNESITDQAKSISYENLQPEITSSSSGLTGTPKEEPSISNSIGMVSSHSLQPAEISQVKMLKSNEQLPAGKSTVISSEKELGSSIYQVIMVKGATGVGFCLEGGVDSPRGDMPITIKRIFKGGPAEKSGLLKVNDEILEVNGLDFTNIRHYEAWNHLKFLDDGEVHITIRRTS